MTKAYLKLANGELFSGFSLGATGKSIGEVVFTTGMTGYTEILTDPSYLGQIVTMTYPLIGNYGVNKEDIECDKSYVKGFIMREYCEWPSNFRNQISLDEFLKEQNIIALHGIDTRKLTKIIRESGVMNGIIYTQGNEPTDSDTKAMDEYIIKDAVKTVTTTTDIIMKAEKPRFNVALLDFGTKTNIARELVSRGCNVTIKNGFTKPDELIGKFDGVMLSNGPGDPSENTEIIANLQELTKSNMPVFGICLGHQLLSLACGLKTNKLKYGHRGANHPVKDLANDRTYITSQNHGYAVIKPDTDFKEATVSHLHVNDETVSGIEYNNYPVFSVQYHPEACSGPRDSMYLFDKFINMMEGK